MKLRKNRHVERAAVNAARAFFESNCCVFQEVDLGNDYGKDAYVDFVDEENVTGICFALQIKGGVSYRLGRDYMIPLDREHAGVWRNSTVPIIGLVYDPIDTKLRWCNISMHLDESGECIRSYIPVSADAILTPDTLRYEIIPNLKRTSSHPVLDIITDSKSTRNSAIFDCFGLGRKDSRILIVLRYLVRTLEDESLSVAIRVLTHVTPHPDIFWHADNWITADVKDKVRQHFRWEISEIILMLNTIRWEQWSRGGFGEDLYMLLRQDPEIESKMKQVAYISINQNANEVAFTALYLSIYWAGEDGIRRYQEMITASPKLRDMVLSPEIENALHEFGHITLF